MLLLSDFQVSGLRFQVSGLASQGRFPADGGLACGKQELAEEQKAVNFRCFAGGVLSRFLTLGRGQI
jgi:hypothetical protein